MSAQTANYCEVIEHLPPGSTLILREVGWDDYEDLLDAIGTAPGRRISYDDGTLQIMTVSSEHENYTRFIEKLVSLATLRLGMKLRSFGSATMKKRPKNKGSEPDCCFYVQSAPLIGNRKQLDFASDPPPDLVVEVEISHQSLSKFDIYAAFAVPEIWRYDGNFLIFYHLNEEEYVRAEMSLALPSLSSEVLTEFLNLTQDQDENSVLLAFEEWLEVHNPLR